MRILQKIILIIRFFRDKTVPWYKKLILAIPLIYLIFPYDFVGDMFPLAGQLDDIAVFIIMWPFLKSMINEYTNSVDKSNDNVDSSDSINLNKDDYEVD